MSTEILRLRIIERPDSFIVEKYAVTRVMVPKERPPKWLRDKGFDAMIRTIHGGCYARKEDDGEWYPVDLEAKEVIYTAKLEEDENRRNFLLNHPHIAIYLISSLASDVDEAKSWLYPTGQLPVEYVDATHRETLNTRQPAALKTLSSEVRG